ncbi:hypothetical protein LBMAG53_05110 [Planctomycetota bacterium]|nr:hypothetical protein LBMAG53_05110 [Planctomycetota bacterium]
MIRPLLAMIAVTVRESWRGGLPWLVLGSAVAVVVAMASLDAVDGPSRSRLAVSLVGGSAAFLTWLLAAVLPATQLRRDLDQRQSLLLFSKPLGKSTYLLGRWLGTLTVLAAAALAVAVAGAVALGALGLGSPGMRRAVAPDAWQRVTGLGEVREIASTQRTCSLDDPAAGDGLRWTFRGLPTGSDLDLLIKVAVRHQRWELTTGECAAQVSAFPAADLRAVPRVLELDPASPYGRGVEERPAPPGAIVLRNRDDKRTALDVDFARLHLPASCLSSDGRAVVQLARLDPQAVVTVERSAGALVATPAGPLTPHLLGGVLVALAPAAVLAAVSLLTATLSGLPTALLAGLTTLIAGNAAWTLRETLSGGDNSAPIRRLLELGLALTPDFSPASVSAGLAAGRALEFDQVWAAWGPLGAWALIALAFAWLALVKKEL